MLMKERIHHRLIVSVQKIAIYSQALINSVVSRNTFLTKFSFPEKNKEKCIILLLLIFVMSTAFFKQSLELILGLSVHG
jgi:hypothetical protein